MKMVVLFEAGDCEAGVAYGLCGLACVIVFDGDGDRMSSSWESCETHEYGEDSTMSLRLFVIGIGAGPRGDRAAPAPWKLVGG